jgi:hypothetical protein
MKSLLRSSILALIVFAAYTAISAPTASFSVPGTVKPCVTGAFCAK